VHWCQEPDCRTPLIAHDRHTRCSTCRSKQRQQAEAAPAATPVLDPLAQIGENATQLMAALPPHSHHRMPLLAQLGRNIPSTTAASLLHAGASTIREAKRKDYSGSDLLHDKYAREVKRQKTELGRAKELRDFIDTACPTKSGEKSPTHHQYTTNALLYQAYCSFTANPMSFHTFWLIKKRMRVHYAGRYLGHFDCSRCITLKKLQHLPEAVLLTGEQAEELRKCRLHERTSFRSASTTS